MNRQEIRKLFQELSPLEEKLKKGESSPEFLSYKNKLKNSGFIDEAGHYHLTKLTKPNFNPLDNSLNSRLSKSSLQNNLRLTQHLRFTHDPLHYDEFISILYVYAGRLKIHFKDHTILLEKGYFCLMGSNVLHSYEIDGGEDIILSFQVEREFLNKELLYGLSNRVHVIKFLVNTVFNKKNEFDYIIFDCSGNERIPGIYEDMFIEYLEPSICGEALVEIYLKLILISLIRGAKDEPESPPASSIVGILEYIESNSRICTLSKLSEKFYLSPKYISFLIKEKTGKSFSELLREARIKEICLYLKNTDLSVQEIAENCGYSNMHFFYSKFKELHHMSPKEYREKHKKKNP